MRREGNSLEFQAFPRKSEFDDAIFLEDFFLIRGNNVFPVNSKKFQM